MASQPTASSLQRARILEAVAELATDRSDERMRREEAARVIGLARRIAVAETGAEAGDAASRAVAEIARHWDPSLMTALEYAEMLPPVVIDRLLRAAPAWATRVTAPAFRRAA